MSAARIRLPAFREFTESIPEAGIEKGDAVWITRHRAVLQRTPERAQIDPHLHLTEPVRLKGGKASG